MLLPHVPVSLGVGNTVGMLDMMHRDCAEDQWIREFTENGIQAVERTGKNGLVHWDVDLPLFDKTGIQNLCCYDTGDSMTIEDFSSFMVNLASGIQGQKIDGNYGLGAKISAWPLNKRGLRYYLYRGGNTAEVVEAYNHGDGYKINLLDPVIAKEWMPDCIIKAGHGTKATFYGNSDGDTMPYNTRRKIIKYLNSMYFEFPKNVSVRVRDGWNPKKPRRELNYLEFGESPNHLRKLTGQKAHLEEHSKVVNGKSLFGKVHVPFGTHCEIAANIYWYVLSTDISNAMKSIINHTGHTAYIYDSELYNRSTQGPVAYGANRTCVIYIEPLWDNTNNIKKLTPTTSRSGLIFDGKNIDTYVSQWATYFQNNMPAELVAYLCSTATDISIDTAVARRINSSGVLNFYRQRKVIDVGRYDLNGNNGLYSDQDGTILIDNIRNKPKTNDGNLNNNNNNNNNGVKDRKKDRQTRSKVGPNDGSAKCNVDTDSVSIVWYSKNPLLLKYNLARSDSEDEDNKILPKDRIGIYDRHNNRIHADADNENIIWSLEQALSGKDISEYKTSVAYQVILREYGITFVELVRGIIKKQNAYSEDELNFLFSPVFFDAASSPLVHRLESIKREVGLAVRAAGNDEQDIDTLSDHGELAVIPMDLTLEEIILGGSNSQP